MNQCKNMMQRQPWREEACIISSEDVWVEVLRSRTSEPQFNREKTKPGASRCPDGVHHPPSAVERNKEK